MRKLAVLLCGALLSVCLGAAPAFANDIYEEDHILITLRDGASEQEVCQAFMGLNWVDDVALPAALADDSMGQVRVLPLAPGASVEDAVAAAAAQPLISRAQPDYLLDAPEPVPTPGVPSLLALTRDLLGDAFPVNDPFLADDPKSYWHLRNMDAFTAWSRMSQGETVTVVTIDSGCMLDHEDLADNLLLDYVYDAYTQSYGAENFRDGVGHGTHVTGIVAAVANNGLGTAGVGFNHVKVLPINIFNPSKKKGSVSALIRAYNYVIDLVQDHPELNIRVINMSLGAYSNLTPANEDVRQRMADALALGVLSVCAAGNGNCSDEMWPSDFAEAFSVTSLSIDGVTPLRSSDFGVAKDLCAPGGDIWSSTMDGDYDFMSGTSMASPQVAAAAALLWSARPDLTVDQVRYSLQKTALPLQAPAGREGLYGAGRLNLQAALAFVQNGGEVSVEPYAPGVYQIEFKPFDSSQPGVPTYWGDAFYWDAQRECWLSLESQEPSEISAADLVIYEGLEKVTISRPGAETPQAPAGDANGNGRLNIVDAQVAYERACGYAIFRVRDALQWITADVNGDGILDSSDALAIQYAIHYGWPL